MVEPIEDVKETKLDKPKDCLEKTWIQVHKTRITAELVGPFWFARRIEADDCRSTNAEASKFGVYGVPGRVVFDLVFEQHIEQSLFPGKLRASRQRRSGHIGESFFIRTKGPIGRKRNMDRSYFCLSKSGSVFVHVNGVCNPPNGRVT